MNQSYNGFRAFAFLSVFFFHTKYLNFSAGYLGVQAFFVLSGFLITPILINTKKGRSFRQYYFAFIGRRILRIFPLYYFYLAFLIIAIVSFNLESKYHVFSGTLSQVIYALTYTYNVYRITDSFHLNHFLSHFWSLAIEEQFYILWPLLIFFSSSKSALKLIIAFIVAGPLLRFAIGWIIQMNFFPFLIDDKYVTVYVSTFSHLDAFATGALFSQINVKSLNSSKIILVSSVVIVSSILMNYISIGYFFTSSLGFQSFMNNSYKYIWAYTVLNFCFGMILMRMKTHSFFPLIFENRMLAYLGKISYGLYVYHYGVLAIVHNWIGTDSSALMSVLGDFCALLITIGVSAASFHLMEIKFINMKDRFFR